MTVNEFAAECEERCIQPSIAMEQEGVEQALSDRDDDRVRELLDTAF